MGGLKNPGSQMGAIVMDENVTMFVLHASPARNITCVAVTILLSRRDDLAS